MINHDETVRIAKEVLRCEKDEGVDSYEVIAFKQASYLAETVISNSEEIDLLKESIREVCKIIELHPPCGNDYYEELQTWKDKHWDIV